MAFERTITSRGHRYRQLVESKWDPVKKQSRIHVIKHLGKVVEEGGKERLIPSQLKVDSIERAYPVGKLALFWKLAEEFGVRRCISRSLGTDEHDVADAIFIMVLNQLIGRKPLTKLGTWVSETSIPRWMDIDTAKLTKDFFLSALDSVSHVDEDGRYSHALEIQHNCVESWRSMIGNEPAKLFFYKDVTRIRYNSNSAYWAENGYGSQVGRPHIGFGLVTSKDSLMPILGFPVRGSHNDSTTVRETVDALNCWDLKDIVLVWDRGIVNKKNILYARGAGFHVLSGGSITSTEVIDEMTRYSDAEIEQRKSILRMSRVKGVYYKDWIGTLYGQECKIVLMLDPMRRNRERTARDLLLQELETSKSKKRIATLKKELQPIVKPSRGRRGYKIDHEREDIARNSDGRSLFFCTDTSIGGREIIRTYFQKDQIEKAFRILRGNACLAPVRYQLPGRVETYLSVISFIAYELIAAVMWKIRKYKIELSLQELLHEAEKIYEVELTSKGSKIYRWTHTTKAVEKTFKPFGILELRT